MGIQSAPKEDLGCSSAELVYGTPLTMPGDFIPSNGTPSDGFELQRLHDRVHSLARIPKSQHGAVPAYVTRNLQQARLVFVRCDAHHTPFQCPYEGPYNTAWLQDLQNQQRREARHCSVGRLKPAHVDLEHSSIQHPVIRPQKRLRQIPQAIPADIPPSHNPKPPITSRQVRTSSGRLIRVLLGPPQMYILVLGGAVWRRRFTANSFER